MSPQDVFKAAQALQMPPNDFVQLYCECYLGSTSRMPIVRLQPRGSIKRCPLLKDRSAIEEVVLLTYKRQIHLISEQYEEEKANQKPSVIPALKTKHKSITIQIKGISGEVASLYEKYRSDGISRDEFVRKKQLLAEEKEKLQSDLSIVETEIENAVNEERKEAESLHAMEQIVSLTELDDEVLVSRMYDDIECITVRDNSSLDIKWKFDVDYSKSYP